MITFRLILAIAILLLAVYFVAMNWGCVIISMINKRKGVDCHHSTVPLVSLILTVFAYISYPYPAKNWIVIIPILDIGNWMLLWFPIVLMKKR